MMYRKSKIFSAVFTEISKYQYCKRSEVQISEKILFSRESRYEQWYLKKANFRGNYK